MVYFMKITIRHSATTAADPTCTSNNSRHQTVPEGMMHTGKALVRVRHATAVVQVVVEMK